MAESTLLGLVGNDPHKVDELITVIAGLILSFLTESHLKGERYARHRQQNQGGAPKPSCDSIHKTVNFDASPIQP